MFDVKKDLISKKRPETAITQFKNSLNNLVDILMGKEPSYIRCIKPNDFKMPSKWNHIKDQVFFFFIETIKKNEFTKILLFRSIQREDRAASSEVLGSNGESASETRRFRVSKTVRTVFAALQVPLLRNLAKLSRPRQGRRPSARVLSRLRERRLQDGQVRDSTNKSNTISSKFTNPLIFCD